MSGSAATPEESRLLSAKVDVFGWRAEQFRRLGFTEAEARDLAASDVDLGQARYLLGSGSSLRLALQILL